jgi:sulfate permease, SulP family
LNAAAMVLVTAAFLTPLFTQLPEPVLGAIVIVAVRGFLRLEPFRRYWRQDHASLLIAATAALAVLLFDLLPGLLVAVALSLVLFIARATEIRVVALGRRTDGRIATEHGPPSDAVTDATLLLRPNGPLFFGNVDRVRRTVVDLVASVSPPPPRVALVLSASFRLSVPVLDSLGELERHLAGAGSELWLVGLPEPARADLARDALAARLGAGRVVARLDDALVSSGTRR